MAHIKITGQIIEKLLQNATQNKKVVTQETSKLASAKTLLGKRFFS